MRQSNTESGCASWENAVGLGFGLEHGNDKIEINAPYLLRVRRKRANLLRSQCP